MVVEGLGDMAIPKSPQCGYPFVVAGLAGYVCRQGGDVPGGVDLKARLD